jgi:hypothetical protein
LPGSSTGTVRRPGSSWAGGALGLGSPGRGSGLFTGGTDSGAGMSGMIQAYQLPSLILLDLACLALSPPRE